MSITTEQAQKLRELANARETSVADSFMEISGMHRVYQAQADNAAQRREFDQLLDSITEKEPKP